MFKIRDVVIDPPLVLAPIAGYTDSVFRQVIKSLGGCGLLVSGLVSTEAMTRHQAKTLHLVHFEESERPISIQIFGSDSERMAKSAAMVEEMGADIVDINLGCPVKKVVRQGGRKQLAAGSAAYGEDLQSCKESNHHSSDRKNSLRLGSKFHQCR